LEQANTVLHGIKRHQPCSGLMVRREIGGKALTAVLDLAYVWYPSM
jgi:hypothetical protein